MVSSRVSAAHRLSESAVSLAIRSGTIIANRLSPGNCSASTAQHSATHSSQMHAARSAHSFATSVRDFPQNEQANGSVVSWIFGSATSGPP